MCRFCGMSTAWHRFVETMLMQPQKIGPLQMPPLPYLRWRMLVQHLLLNTRCPDGKDCLDYNPDFDRIVDMLSMNVQGSSTLDNRQWEVFQIRTHCVSSRSL